MQFRERDERDRLVSVKILERGDKYKELEEADDDKLAPRPYLTVVGGILFFVGMFCTWLPLCDVIGIIFPGTRLSFSPRFKASFRIRRFVYPSSPYVVKYPPMSFRICQLASNPPMRSGYSH